MLLLLLLLAIKIENEKKVPVSKKWTKTSNETKIDEIFSFPKKNACSFNDNL